MAELMNTPKTPVHPPEILQEINQALTLDPGDLVQRRDSLSDEALVHLIRRFHGEAQFNLANDLTRCLLERIGHMLHQGISGFSEPLLSQVRDEILDRFH